MLPIQEKVIKEMELKKTLLYYSNKINSWLNKKTQSSIISEKIGTTSYYVSSKKEVHLVDGASERTYAHEFGHEFFARINPKICTDDLFEMAILIGWEKENLLKELNELGSLNAIRIFTDYLSLIGLREVRKLGFISHPANYSQSRKNSYENETFAEFFAVLATKDWECFQFMMNTFPKFCDSCFMAIENGIFMTA